MTERDEVPALDLVRLQAQSLSRDTPLELEWEQPVIAAGEDPGRHVGPRLERPGLFHRRPGFGRLAPLKGLLDDVGGHVVEVDDLEVVGCLGRQADPPEIRQLGLLARGIGPPGCARFTGPGIIAFTSTMSTTGCRSATIGAPKPASDCATRIASVRPSMARSTAAAYSPQRAVSSPAGRSTAIASWPNDLELGDDAVPVPRLAAGSRMRTNVAIETGGRRSVRGCERTSDELAGWLVGADHDPVVEVPLSTNVSPDGTVPSANKLLARSDEHREDPYVEAIHEAVAKQRLDQVPAAVHLELLPVASLERRDPGRYVAFDELSGAPIRGLGGWPTRRTWWCH